MEYKRGMKVIYLEDGKVYTIGNVEKKNDIIVLELYNTGKNYDTVGTPQQVKEALMGNSILVEITKSNKDIIKPI